DERKCKGLLTFEDASSPRSAQRRAVRGAARSGAGIRLGAADAISGPQLSGGPHFYSVPRFGLLSGEWLPGNIDQCVAVFPSLRKYSLERSHHGSLAKR